MDEEKIREAYYKKVKELANLLDEKVKENTGKAITELPQEMRFFAVSGIFVAMEIQNGMDFPAQVKIDILKELGITVESLRSVAVGKN